MLSTKVNSIHPVRGGRNSRIFKFESNNKKYALKFYRNDENSLRNRFNAEITALTIFNKYNNINVPKLISTNESNNCVILEWIDGTEIKEYKK